MSKVSQLAGRGALSAAAVLVAGGGLLAGAVPASAATATTDSAGVAEARVGSARPAGADEARQAAGSITWGIPRTQCNSAGLFSQAYQDERGVTGVNQFQATYKRQYFAGGRWLNEFGYTKAFRSTRFVDGTASHYVYWPNASQTYGWQWSVGDRRYTYRINVTFVWKNSAGQVVARRVSNSPTCYLR